MITTHLTADQLLQLEALLADTTPGGGLYRPPVARDVEILRDLETAGLSRFTIDCGYEITDAGRAAVVGRAKDIADGQAFVMYADDDELLAAIDALKLEAARYLDGDGNADLRERTLLDIEACQNELDRRAEAWPATEPEAAEGQSESTGRHRLVEVDDRPTTVIPPMQELTAPMPSVGTLPGLPVVDGIPVDPDQDATVRLLAAIRATPTPEELAEVAEATTAGWDALEADLADDRFRPLPWYIPVLIAVVATIIGTWFAAWLVMGR